MFDLHTHDEFSTFDGFGKAEERAMLAVEYHYSSICTTNHGNTNGLIATYQAAKKYDLKAILGVEGYFLPKYVESKRGYHLILLAKNLNGYRNLNAIQTEGEKQKYYNPIWTFDLLEKYHDDLICTAACVASYSSQCIIKGDIEKAKKYLRKMQSIFGDDFYIEIQPYKISEIGLQEKVNVELIKLSKELNIKCILTSDSHRGRKDDLPTYIKMHEIAGHDTEEIRETYSERYMPLPGEIESRFYKMHLRDFNSEKECKAFIKEMMSNLDEIENKCEKNYLDELELKLPKLQGNSKAEIKNKIIAGLKERGKFNKLYVDRCKEELSVIYYHGFEDYFLIVADYVNWAKSQGIVVGPGRGSVCNSIVAYALKITEVDSIIFDLDFRRFLRKDKKKFPDIDLDFETSRRHEVIEYLCKKYSGHAARICSYGLYKVDNLINDLAKVCGLPTDKAIDSYVAEENAKTIKEIKKIANSFVNEDGDLDTDELLKNKNVIEYNRQYEDIFIHFSKLYLKMRYIGTHAAGVAITGGDILDYVALRIDKSGELYTNYDLNDIEGINVIKFDILGLQTMESIGDLRKETGVTCNYDEIIKDPKILENFRTGNCDGVFQLESNTVKKIMDSIKADCFMDIVAATSMNRPGALKAKAPQQYAENKFNLEKAKQSRYYEFTKDSYGTIIYQEQLQQICVYIAGMTWEQADKMLKLMKHGEDVALQTLKKARENGEEDLQEIFISGCLKNNLSQKEAEQLFNSMLVYSFVKGHGTGYTLISFEEMFYKTYFPTEYWYSKIKFAKADKDYDKYCRLAVKDGAVVFLPHVNYSAEKCRLRKIQGENCIQQGLTDIKGVGLAAAQVIAEERKKGIFIDFDDFYERTKNRAVTIKIIKLLEEYGALEFDKNKYISRVKRYNAALYARNL